jgi:hypothetical protein
MLQFQLSSILCQQFVGTLINILAAALILLYLGNGILSLTPMEAPNFTFIFVIEIPWDGLPQYWIKLARV